MRCCLCGDHILPGDLVLRITPHRVVEGPKRGGLILEDSVSMEDGTTEKLTHWLCPAKFASMPASLIGGDLEKEY